MNETKLIGWHKRVIDGVMPIVNAFAVSRKATVRESMDGLNVRVVTANGVVTIQVSIRGRGDDNKLEVTGIRRSGVETKRTIFQLKQDQPVDDGSFKEALDLALIS